MTLLEEVSKSLSARGIRYAVIGAAAMATHGVARATMDVDLLLVGRGSFETDVWNDLRAAGVTVEIRRGDADDPLVGVVWLRRKHDIPVDIVIGSGSWQQRAVDRARQGELLGTKAPVATATDLILLKLYAGAPQDRWDIARLLSASDDPELEKSVSDEVGDLPEECRSLWRSILEQC